MREQIRLWFYSQLFMSVALVGRAPFVRVLGYEKMLDEQGREMHGSWGNMILAEDAFARMGADVMRWQFCAQPPNQNLLFGFGPAAPIMPFLTDHLWRNLVQDGPESVHLAAWPEVAEPDRALLEQMAEARTVVTLAHQARAATGLKLRQPLRRLVVEGAGGARRYAE